MAEGLYLRHSRCSDAVRAASPKPGEASIHGLTHVSKLEYWYKANAKIQTVSDPGLISLNKDLQGGLFFESINR